MGHSQFKISTKISHNNAVVVNYKITIWSLRISGLSLWLVGGQGLASRRRHCCDVVLAADVHEGEHLAAEVQEGEQLSEGIGAVTTWDLTDLFFLRKGI
jgi:hypothetical protein